MHFCHELGFVANTPFSTQLLKYMYGGANDADGDGGDHDGELNDDVGVDDDDVVRDGDKQVRVAGQNTRAFGFPSPCPSSS